MAQPVAASPFSAAGITFNVVGKKIEVSMETSDLQLRSVQRSDRPAFEALVTDHASMESYADNGKRLAEKPIVEWEREQIERVGKRMDVWVSRWEGGDPYSAFAIFKKGTAEFIGQFTAGHGREPGQTEIAGYGYAREWSKGYGTQAAEAVIQRYLPALRQSGYQMEGKDLEAVTATAHEGNAASVAILRKMGFKPTAKVEEWGSTRDLYTYYLRA